MRVALSILAFMIGYLLGSLVFGSTAEAFNSSVYRLRPIDNPRSGGTGFAIEHKGETYLLSNRHVCEITDKGTFIAENGDAQYAAIVEAISPTDDLCLLRVSKHLKAKRLSVSTRSPLPGELVLSVGYPALANQVRSVGVLQSYEAQPSGYVQGAFIVMGKTNFRAIPGMSGSPVFDVLGDVVGVIARLSIVDAHSTLFVTGDRVRAFLAATDTEASVAKTIRLEALTAAIKHRIQYDLIMAIIEIESSFNPLAIGKDGEIGLMQLHPKWHTPKLGDIEHNVDQATKYLHYLKERFQSRYGDAWYVTYNVGPSRPLQNPKSFEYYKRVSAALRRVK